MVSAKAKNIASSLKLQIQVEREQHVKEIEQMKRGQTEKELVTASIHLAMQTELLANFRNELRHIVREIETPIEALNQIKKKLKELPCEQIDWMKFEQEFTSVHPEFRVKLIEKYPDLTKQEVKMCQLARLGLKSIEMAQLLCLSERSIESHRYTLRKKLGIAKEKNLAQFLSTIR